MTRAFVGTDEDLDLQDPLPIQPRDFGKHDLPPKWDGAAVEWRGWEAQPWTSADFHLRPECCHFCGSFAKPTMNMGLQVDPPTPAGIVRRVMRWFAYRCPDCRRDQVHDYRTDEWWDLDDSDYGDEGSDEPRTKPV